MTTRLLLVHARSPLHAGTGQATAAVDLPIARDRATNHPILPGSSLKGALRARALGVDPPRTSSAFGPPIDKASDHAGALVFTDARLVLLPVRSLHGTFAWVTCPFVLARLDRDAREAGLTVPSTKAEKGLDFGAVVQGHALGDRIVLEDVALTPDVDGGADKVADALAAWTFPDDPAWQAQLRRRLVVVHDDLFTFFARHATEIVTRVSIDATTGTAQKGQLWTEENLPAESVLAGLVAEVRNGKTTGEPLAWLHELVAAPIQLGGKATVGRGRCQILLGGGR